MKLLPYAEIMLDVFHAYIMHNQYKPNIMYTHCNYILMLEKAS